jgi:putative GTP pyrophosphokinase
MSASNHWVEKDAKERAPKTVGHNYHIFAEMTGEHTEVAQAYEELIPRYQQLVDEVKFALDNRIKASGLKVVSVHGRVKTLNSLRSKIERKDYEDPLADIHDLAGVRVVCQFTPDLDVVDKLIRELFEVHEVVDKSGSLGFDKMGYQGAHYIVTLGPNHRGARYNELAELKSEIQVRTILQDAWAQISHSLDYKSAVSVPERERRELYNVSSLLEVSQNIFDRTLETRERYSEEVRKRQPNSPEFLEQPIDRETLAAYTRWKYPNLPVKENLQELLIRDLDHSRFRTLKDMDDVIVRANDAVNAYSKEVPHLFTFGTDYITKSMGFVDEHFKRAHCFGTQTREGFARLSHLVQKR